MGGMTGPSTGAGGTAVGIATGDTVWTRGRYDGTDADGYPLFSRREGGMIPDHPALRRVARWLRETPDALEDLRTLRWALDQLGHIDEEQSVPTLDALIAALSTDGGA